MRSEKQQRGDLGFCNYGTLLERAELLFDECARLRALCDMRLSENAHIQRELVRLTSELAEKDALIAKAKRILRQLYGNMPDGVEVEVGEWLHDAGKEGKG